LINTNSNNNAGTTDVGTICGVDDLTVDFARRKVFDSNQREIALSALSFDTFRVLIEASPAVMTANDLIDRAWRGSVVSDETVTQRIRLLRKALHDDRRRPRYIETIRNVGYRLIPPVSEARPIAKSTALPARFHVGSALIVLTLFAVIWLVRTTDEQPITELPVAAVPQGPVTATELAEQARNLVRQRNQDSQGHAIRLYEQALQLEPDNAEVRASLSLALSTSVAWYGDTLDIATRAERLAREALESGAFFRAEFALGFSLDAQGKVEPARAAYERAVALDPTHYGARASLAYLLQVKGQLVEALSHNMIAFEQAPPGTLDTQIASCLRLLGFYSVASEWLDRADRLDPDSAHAAPSRALDLITRNEFELARSVIDDALARGVIQVELYEYLVVLALLENDLESAAEIIESVPASISHRGPVIVWRGIIDALRSGTVEEVIEFRNELLLSIEAGDTWPESLLYIALLEAVAGHHDETIQTLKRLEAAGYRDHLWLAFLPPFQVLHEESQFLNIVKSMRSDAERQHEQVLTADWLPLALRTSQGESINP